MNKHATSGRHRRPGTSGHVLLLLAALVPAIGTGHANALQRATGGEERGLEFDLFEPLTEEPSAGNAGLFVGVNEFADDTLSQLQFAVHDAVELAYLFVNELKLLPAKHSYLLLSGEPEAESVQKRLETLRRQGVTVRAATRSEILVAFVNMVLVGVPFTCRHTLS